MADGQGAQRQQAATLTAEQLETGRKWLRLVAQARADKTLKQRLIDTPIQVLQEHGIGVRKGLDIRVVEYTDKVENTDKIVYLRLPPDDLNLTLPNSSSQDGELTAEDLSKVTGGAALVEYGLLVGLIAVVCTVK